MPIANSRGQIARRAQRRDGWTVAKRRTFLEVLGETCNVTRATAAAGMAKHSAYRLKKRDPAFALLWAGAIEAGTERLREAVLAHTLAQVPSGDNPDADTIGSPAATGPFDLDAALKALKALEAPDGTRRSRRQPAPYASDEEVVRLLADRLERLAARLGGA